MHILWSSMIYHIRGTETIVKKMLPQPLPRWVTNWTDWTLCQHHHWRRPKGWSGWSGWSTCQRCKYLASVSSRPLTHASDLLGIHRNSALHCVKAANSHHCPNCRPERITSHYLSVSCSQPIASSSLMVRTQIHLSAWRTSFTLPVPTTHAPSLTTATPMFVKAIN